MVVVLRCGNLRPFFALACVCVWCGVLAGFLCSSGLEKLFKPGPDCADRLQSKCIDLAVRMRHGRAVGGRGGGERGKYTILPHLTSGRGLVLSVGVAVWRWWGWWFVGHGGGCSGDEMLPAINLQ